MKGFLFLSKLKNARTVHVFKAEVHFLYSVIISALGYFVDIYDLLLFGIVRIPSLKALGLNPDADGTFILNCQMVGLLIGGVFWGFLETKRKVIRTFRIHFSVFISEYCLWFFTLFSKRAFSLSIRRFKVYSRYWVSRELGAGITLVSESLPKSLRAIGTSVVAGFGLMGAVVAQLTVESLQEDGIYLISLAG